MSICTNCVLLVCLYDREGEWHISPGLAAILIMEHVLLIIKFGFSRIVPEVRPTHPMLYFIHPIHLSNIHLCKKPSTNCRRLYYSDMFEEFKFLLCFSVCRSLIGLKLGEWAMRLKYSIYILSNFSKVSREKKSVNRNLSEYRNVMLLGTTPAHHVGNPAWACAKCWIKQFPVNCFVLLTDTKWLNQFPLVLLFSLVSKYKMFNFELD